MKRIGPNLSATQSLEMEKEWFRGRVGRGLGMAQRQVVKHVPPPPAMARWRPLLAAIVLLPFSLAQYVPGELCCPGCAYSNALNCCCDPSRPLTAVTSTAVTTAAVTSTTTLVSTVRSFTSTTTRTVTVAGDTALLRLGMLVSEGVRVPLPGSDPPDAGGTSTDDFLSSGRFGIAGDRLGGSPGATAGTGGDPGTERPPDTPPPQWSLKELRIGSLERDRLGMKRRTLNVTSLGALAEGPPPASADGPRLQRRHLCVDCPDDLVLGAYRMFYGRTGRARQSGSDAVACCPGRSTTTVTSTVVVLDLATATRTTTLAGVRTTFVTVVRTATSRSRTTSATRTTSTSRTLRTVTQPNVITQVLAGRAFFDVNEDGVYDPEVDIPYANQPLAFLTGPSDPPADEAGTTLTDAEGLFSASVAVAPDAFVSIAPAGDTGKPFMTLQADANGVVPDGDQIELPVPVTTTTTPFTATTSPTASSTLTTSRTSTISLTQSPTASVTRTATATTGTGSTTTTLTSVTTSSSRTTTFASITISSGLPVFVACPNLPASQDGRCGADPGTRCTANICCSSSGFCEDDGGDSGAAWCGTGCQRGYGKCWANVTDTDGFSCPTYTRTTSATRTTLTDLTTTFASITLSSGTPVFVPCPNYPSWTALPPEGSYSGDMCGPLQGMACPTNLCCARNGACQNDGGQDGEGWCGSLCQRGWGKCWANVTDPERYSCTPWTTRTTTSTQTTTFASITFSVVTPGFGIPVFVPCPNVPGNNGTSRCGVGFGVACTNELCCSSGGFCQDDGGNNGAAWCDAGCQRGYGKCWANVTDPDNYPCPLFTKTRSTTTSETRTTSITTTPFVPITTSSGVPVFLPCPDVPVSTTNKCGDNLYQRCPDGLCCSSANNCQNDGGDNGAAWCGAGCQRGYGKCWANVSDPENFACPQIATYTQCPRPFYICLTFIAFVHVENGATIRTCEAFCDRTSGCNSATLENGCWAVNASQCARAVPSTGSGQSFKGDGFCLPCTAGC